MATDAKSLSIQALTNTVRKLEIKLARQEASAAETVQHLAAIRQIINDATVQPKTAPKT